MWPYIRLRDFFVWSCDISHLLLLFVNMILNHWHTIGRVRSWVAFCGCFRIFDSFPSGILGCIASIDRMCSRNWVAALRGKEALAHWALYLACVSGRCLHLIWLHHGGIHWFIIWASSPCECLWRVSGIIGLEFLLAIWDTLIFVLFRNNGWLLEMLGGIRYHDVCRMLLIIHHVLSILHDVWKRR